MSEEDLRWGLLQDYIVRYFDGRHSIFEIARANDLVFEDVRDYLGRFAAKELVELAPIRSIDDYTALQSLKAAGT